MQPIMQLSRGGRAVRVAGVSNELLAPCYVLQFPARRVASTLVGVSLGHPGNRQKRDGDHGGPKLSRRLILDDDRSRSETGKCEMSRIC